MKISKKHLIPACIIALIIPAYIFTQNFFPGGEIFLTHQDNPNFHKVLIQAKDLRYPFFGLAFHLKYDPNTYEFDHYSLGDFFTSQDDPITLVNNKENTIITGISLKRGQSIKSTEGTLLNLYFKHKNPQENLNSFAFENTVYSTFDKERKDIGNFIFNSH